MRFPSWSTSRLITGLVIVTLSVLVILLSLRNEELRRALEACVPTAGEPLALGRGDKLPVLKATNLNGDSVCVDFSAQGSPFLVIVFSTNCTACTRSVSCWSHLAGYAEQYGFRMVVVSIHDRYRTAQFLKSNPVSIPVVLAPDSLFKREFKVGRVPQVLLVDAAGLLSRAWIGRIDERTCAQIKESLSESHQEITPERAGKK